MKEKYKKPDPIVRLSIRTYKIPVTIEDGKIIQSTVDLTDDMISKTQNIEIDRTKENVSLKIPEYTKNVATYNSNQEKYTLQLKRDYISKQILTKQ